MVQQFCVRPVPFSLDQFRPKDKVGELDVVFVKRHSDAVLAHVPVEPMDATIAVGSLGDPLLGLGDSDYAVFTRGDPVFHAGAVVSIIVDPLGEIHCC